MNGTTIALILASLIVHTISMAVIAGSNIRDRRLLVNLSYFVGSVNGMAFLLLLMKFGG